jgi:hypothetical protein
MVEIVIAFSLVKGTTFPTVLALAQVGSRFARECGVAERGTDSYVRARCRELASNLRTRARVRQRTTNTGSPRYAPERVSSR